MNVVIEFLKGKNTDAKGRTLEQVLNLSDEELEHSHDIIQWLFPLTEPSRCQPGSPVLTAGDLPELNTAEVRANILKAFARFTKFYNNSQWLTPHNHNYLRLTRILKCLGLAGLDKEKRSLKGALNAIYIQHGNVIGEETKKFWNEA